MSVHWHVQISNLAIGAKYFSKVIFTDIFCELLNDDLSKLECVHTRNRELAFVLLIGLGVLPRLTLRVSLLYLPFRRGVRLAERGEIVRRALERFLESGLSSEYGDRLRGRPRSEDREGILRLALELEL